jgi:GMP synthase-like glutamine amidotransferase
MDKSRILIVQHAPWEGPGRYAEILAAAGAQPVTVRPDLGEEVPDPEGYDGVVVMGGLMGATDETTFPWLAAEKRMLAAAVDAQTPVFAVCLGAQLLALATGGRVRPGPAPELGIHTVRLTPAALTDPLFEGLPRRLSVFQWHGDAFEPGPGAVTLAHSPLYPCQAVRVGRGAYGLQFHLEISAGMLAEWSEVPACAADAERVMGPGGFSDLLAELSPHETGQDDLARHIFDRWLKLVSRREDRPVRA